MHREVVVALQTGSGMAVVGTPDRSAEAVWASLGRVGAGPGHEVALSLGMAVGPGLARALGPAAS